MDGAARAAMLLGGEQQGAASPTGGGAPGTFSSVLDFAPDDSLDLPVSQHLQQQLSHSSRGGAASGQALSGLAGSATAGSGSALNQLGGTSLGGDSGGGASGGSGDGASGGGGGAARPLQQSLAAIKLSSQRIAGLIKKTAEKTVEAVKEAPTVLGGPRESPSASSGDAGGIAGLTPPGNGVSIARLRATATELSVIARETSSRLLNSATDGFKWLSSGDSLLTLCRNEPSVPQVVVACCSALLAGDGVRTLGIFRLEATEEELGRISHCLSGGRATLLIPPGTSPHAIAGLLKRFLSGLPEPLLTFRMLPDWIAAASDPDKAIALLPQLPAAHSNVLRLLLEVAHYVNQHAADTEIDSLSLAQALAPCVAWLPPGFRAHGPTATGDAAAAAAGDGRVPLDGAEAQAVVMLLESLIDRFGLIYG